MGWMRAGTITTAATPHSLTGVTKTGPGATLLIGVSDGSTVIYLCVVSSGCDAPLGMQSGNITDDQITASSHLLLHEAHNARFNNTMDTWMAASNRRGEYLKINATLIGSPSL